MLRKLIGGILFGTGFGVAFVAVVVIYLQYFARPSIETKLGTPSSVLNKPPDISRPDKYLGSSASHSSGFQDSNAGTLSNGPGEIIGKAELNGQPVSGLKLRLALNGSVYSQWVTTGVDGEYVASVPYGEYRIDGYEFDPRTTDAVLAGKILHPNGAHGGTVSVKEGNSAHGLTFRFVDPIEKAIAKNKYAPNENVVVSWVAYPGASQYVVQVSSKSEPHGFSGHDYLFHWSERPVVSNTSFDFSQHDVQLSPGKFYVVEIEARDAKGAALSKTANLIWGYDFEVTERQRPDAINQE